MYTRGPSIANIFQKAVLLKDTKCNKIIQRQLCSEPMMKFSKIEKLKPLKRYYSGASSNNRNPNQKYRSVQGVGHIRKTFPKFPREIAQQQQALPMNQQMATGYIQNKQGIASSNLGLPLNSFNENATNASGKITIVLDKNEICACSAPNETVQIYVTTLPETTKCNCCQQCQQVKNSGIQNMFPKSPIGTPFQQSSNMSSSTNPFSVRHQNVGLAFPRYQQSGYGLSERKFSVFDERRPLYLTKSRSVNDFPAMRKLLVSNTINPTQPKTRHLHSPSINRTQSLCRVNPSGRFSNNPQTMFPRTRGPNIIPMRRSFSFHSQYGQHNQHGTPKADPLPVQQPKSSGIAFPNPDHHTKSHPVDILKNNQHTKTMGQLNKYGWKYSSFHQNSIGSVIPENSPVNQPDAKQSKQPRDKVEINRSRPKVDQQASNGRFIVERVIRPATFSSVGRVISNNTGGSIASALNQIALNQKIKSLPGPRTVKSSSVPFTSKRNLFNFQREVIKNRFPAERASGPRAFTFKNRSGFNGALQSDKVSTIIGRFGSRQTPTSPGIGPMGNARQPNILSKSKFSLQPLSIPPKQRSTESINRSRQLQLVVPKNRSETQTSFKQNHLIKKLNPPNVSYRQKSNSGQHQGRLRADRMIPMGQTKQPPLFLLKKRSPVMITSRQKNRQPLQTHRRSFIPILQKGHLQPDVNSKQFRPQKERTQSFPNYPNRTRPSLTMIPVRNRILQQNLQSLRSMPIQPFKTFPNMKIKQQQKPTEHQRHQPNAAKRVKRGQLQSSLPVVVSKKTNEIEKPQAVATAGRPYSNQLRKNPRRLQPMPPQPQETASTPQERAIQPDRQPRRLQPMTPQPREIQSTPQERVIQPDIQRPSSSMSPESEPVQVDKSNLQAKNPAVLFYAPGKLQLVDFPVPRLADKTGVIVKMLYVHLTDTDAQMLSAKQDGPYKLSQPTIAGKSGSGVIVDAGKEVDNVKIGDKVSVKGLSCGKCTACQNDNEVICERVPINEKLGILKRFHAVPAKFVTKLPDSVHPIDGAMIDELSSAIRACKKSTVTAGDNVLVLGGKSLGLWTALAAKSMGATKVCLADDRPLVLDQAKKLGIERVFLIDAKTPVPNIVNRIAEYMEGENPRIVFDCNGSSLTNYIAINTSMIGGKVVFMKNAVSNQPMFLTNAVDRGVDILSSQHGNTESERAALQFLSTGKVQLRGIDSSFFKITDVREAFGLLNSGTTANIFIQPSRPDDENDRKK